MFNGRVDSVWEIMKAALQPLAAEQTLSFCHLDKHNLLIQIVLHKSLKCFSGVEHWLLS